ncbi:protein kinase [Chamaesiphon sp. GL140_3_metabinner_50]|uniref:protein kinase domain-containing protein n=1 Tax=Chamaesiphon sp. GL140_3_metabinner_50 TaxID=2970812 RepID=UPI003459E870
MLIILQYLHHQSPPLIHRDLKPHNIIRDDNGRVFLVDFGAVQNVYNNTLLKGSTVAGTYGYMAPEQFRGAAVPASDLYGLGAIILYLLTHRSPADLPQERLKLNFRSHVNISHHFADWLETMLEPATSARFSSARIALSNLEKQHWFSKRRKTRFNFSWINGAVATIILSILVPLICEYRHTVVARLGLPVTDICDAIMTGDVKSLHRYLDRGVSVNATVEINQSWDNYSSRSSGYLYNGSMLDCAIEQRKDKIVENLLKRGADPNVSDGYNTLRDTYHLTVTGGSTIVGTYGYMAPEQFRGQAVLATDLYGLGTTLLYLLLGQNPADLPVKQMKIDFRNSLAEELRQRGRLLPNFSNWLNGLLEPIPEDRYRNAAL